MPFPLQNIELHIDDSILAVAEKLLEEGKLTNITESESGLWIGQVSVFDENYEVEILLKGKQVKAHTCDCGKSGKNKYCEHVAATLLSLLNKNKEKETKVLPKKEQKMPKRITMNYILDLVDPSDLKHFIREYARQDRNFALLLKAHFAYLLPRTKDNEAVGQVLSNSIKAFSRPGKTLNKNDWKVLQKILKTLLQQAEDALYNKNYAEVFDTSEAILQELPPLLLLVEKRKVLVDTINQVIDLLQKLNEQGVAPELEDQIWTLCFTEAQKNTYFLYELWSPLLRFLVKLVANQKQNKSLQGLLDQRLKDSFVQKNDHIFAGIVSYKIQLFELQNNEAALNQYLEENINHPEVLKQAILLARQQENWKQLQQLSTFAISKQKGKGTDLTYLQSQLLEAAVQQKKRKEVLRLSKELFLQTKEMDYFHLLKKTAGKKWSSYFESLLVDFQQQTPNIENRKTLAHIYMLEDKPEALLNHLRQVLSIDLLKDFDHILFEYNTVATNNLYQDIISHYLENYMGRPAAIKIRESLSHLKENGHLTLVKNLRKGIQKEYAERGSLLEELKEV